MQKVISPLYYAREDTRTPFRYAVHAMIVNAAVALGLAPFIGFIAAALGTTVAGWVMLFQLWRGTRPMGDAADATPGCGAPCPASPPPAWSWASRSSSPQHVLLPAPSPTRLLRYVALALLVALGIAAYAAAALATGALRPPTSAPLRAAAARP